MILASLLLILVAVILLVLGLVGGSSGLLIGSIAASLLAAVALVVGARQAAAARAADETRRADDDRSPRRRGPADGLVDPVGASVPTQHAPSSTGSGRPTDARSAATGEVSDGRAEAADDEAPADEPPAQAVPAADADRVARMSAEVLVIDGRPRYHLPRCPQLSGRNPEALPVKEAVELGFTPCGRCEPDSSLLADARHG